MQINFKKYSGHGNDFILIDKSVHNLELSEKETKRICDRKFGVGADGVLYIMPASSAENDYKIKIINRDGSEASMCGNASRIAMAYHYEKHHKENINFETSFANYNGRVEGENYFINMTQLYDVDKYDISDLTILGGMYMATGVAHAVIQVKNLENFDVIKEGLKIRHDERFEGGTNVCFFEVISPKKIRFRVFEKGVEDETDCCGTGVMATAITCKEMFNWTGEIEVLTNGGQIIAKVNDDLSLREFGGIVDHCFDGTYEIR